MSKEAGRAELSQSSLQGTFPQKQGCTLTPHTSIMHVIPVTSLCRLGTLPGEAQLPGVKELGKEEQTSLLVPEASWEKREEQLWYLQLLR